MSLLLVAALSGVLSSPVAHQGIPEPEFTEERFWDEWHRNCDNQEAEPDRVRCRQCVRELQVLSTQPAKGMRQRFMKIAKQDGGLCPNDDLKKYGLSRDACEKHFSKKVPECERRYLTAPIPGFDGIIGFIGCILPPRACNEFTTSADPAWKAHCAELAMDGNS